MINAEMQKRLNRSGTIVGQRLEIEGLDGRFGAYEIVGVVGTVKRTSAFEHHGLKSISLARNGQSET